MKGGIKTKCAYQVELFWFTAATSELFLWVCGSVLGESHGTLNIVVAPKYVVNVIALIFLNEFGFFLQTCNISFDTLVAMVYYSMQYRTQGTF